MPITEQLPPAVIPRLEPDSSNWAIFMMRFKDSMKVTSRWGYFNGSQPKPRPKDVKNPTDTEIEVGERWEHEDAVASYLLSQRLPDATVMRMVNCACAQDRWELVTKEFQAKSKYAQANLHQSFLDMHCARGGDVREFLASLSYKKETLAAAGMHVMEREHKHTILCGIPSELATFASTILVAAQVSNTSTDLDALANHICEEADRLKLRCTKGGNQGGGKKEATDEALAATTSEGGKRRRKGKCHNCGKPGHWVKECRSPKKEKSESASTNTSQTAQTQSSAPKPENKPVGSANAVVPYDFDGDGFWMAEEEATDKDLARIVSAEPDPLLGILDDTWHLEGEESPGFGLELEETDIGAVLTQAEEDHDTRIHTELYDLGATRHISPYKTDFISYTPLAPPVYLNAENQQRFPTIGRGTLVVHVPNGEEETQLTLHAALHAPAVSYTLVSLGALDEEGYHPHIGAGHMELTSPQGERVGRIPRTQGRLYKMVHALDSTNTVEPVLVMEWHRRLGHIAVENARKLMESGAVVGIELDPSSQEGDCDACIFVRATRLPVPKVQISSPAQNFRDEVHTDVWGPATIATCQNQRYFVTFTDNATRYTVTYLLRTKDEAFEAYKSFEAWATTQQHCKGIKTPRSDHGGEYLSAAFDQHLSKAGMTRKLTTHDTPQLNGIAEQLNRTLLEHIRAFTHSSRLPKSLWGEALRHATWLKNRTAMRALDGKTPFKALYGRPPDLSALQMWGTTVWVHHADGSKLDICARTVRWLRLDVNTKAHHIFWPSAGNVTVKKNIYFGTSALLEGEQNIPIAGSEQAAAPLNPLTSIITRPARCPPQHRSTNACAREPAGTARSTTCTAETFHAHPLPLAHCPRAASRASYSPNAQGALTRTI